MGLFNRKVELYDWARGVEHWRYTNGDRAQTVLGLTYQPASLSRTSLADTQESMKNRLDITAPLSLPLLELYMGGQVPSELITLTLYQWRNSMLSTVWQGVLANPKFSSKDVVLHHLPPDASAAALGMTQPWSKTCHKALYSAGDGRCNASRTTMRVDATVSACSGFTLSAPAFASYAHDWFTRGWVQWASGLTTERRRIIGHVGDTLTLSAPAALPVGTAVTAYPGCDQQATTCRDKFNNIPHFGGCPWLPSKNPFGSNPLF